MASPQASLESISTSTAKIPSLLTHGANVYANHVQAHVKTNARDISGKKFPSTISPSSPSPGFTPPAPTPLPVLAWLCQTRLVLKGIIGYSDYSFAMVIFECFKSNGIFVFLFKASLYPL